MVKRIVATVVLACLLTGDRACGQTPTCLSLDPSGLPGDAHSPGFAGSEISISGDGRYVAFSSKASNLVPGDTNRCDDVFVCDSRTKKVQRASVSSGGAEADRGGSHPRISADGRYVV